MKVKELIEELKKYDGDLDINLNYYNEYGSECEATIIDPNDISEKDVCMNSFIEFNNKLIIKIYI